MKKAAALTLGVLVLDQVVKAALRISIPFGHEIPLLPIFSLVHVQNTGAAFGILPRSNLFFIAVSILILALLAKLGRELSAQGSWARAGLPLVWAGALGNLIDRLRHGAVTDFLDVHWRGWHWPAFNVADSAISVGIACLVIQHFVPRQGR